MSRDAKKSMGWAVILIALGIAALFAGVRSLVFLIPAAVLVWHSTRPIPRRGRN